MKTHKTESIILRRTNYGEADRVLSLLTPDYGKISAIAKGVRKSKSKLAGGLELFATSNVTIIEGRGEMGLIASARLIRFYKNVLSDYDRMQLGYDLIKIVNKATETVAEADFYYLLRDSFVYLDELAIDHCIVELWFRLQLGALLGRSINLSTSTDDKKLEVDQKYNFSFDDMAFEQCQNGKFIADHIKFLRLIQAKNPAVLRQVSGLGQVIGDCLWLARALDE
ncbi:MAG: DNA repair protein RecO [Candidatus Woesebacteria bacterium]|jgi:DNA repair protein RecO (recombination protein O)